MKSPGEVRYSSPVLLKRLQSHSYLGTFYPKELQEVNLNEDRVYRLLGYVTDGSSPRTQRSRSTMTGRGTPVTALELAEPLMSLPQGLPQVRHQPHGLRGHPQLSQWKILPISSPSIPFTDSGGITAHREHGTHYGKLERTFWGCARLTMGCLGEGPKTGEGKDQIGLGRNQYGRIQKKRDKRSWTYVKRLLASMLARVGAFASQGSIPGGDGFGVLQDTNSQAVQRPVDHQEVQKRPEVTEARIGKQQQIRKQMV